METAKKFKSSMYKNIHLNVIFGNGCFFIPFVDLSGVRATAFVRSPKNYACELFFKGSGAYQTQYNFIKILGFLGKIEEATDPKTFLRSVLFFDMVRDIPDLETKKFPPGSAEGWRSFRLPGGDQLFQIDSFLSENDAPSVDQEVVVVTINDRKDYWRKKGKKIIVPEFFCRKIWSSRVSQIFSFAQQSLKDEERVEPEMTVFEASKIVDKGGESGSFLTREEALFYFPALSKIDLDDETFLSPHRYTKKEWGQICDDIHSKEAWGRLSHFFEEYEDFYWPKDKNEFLFEVSSELTRYSFFDRELYLPEKLRLDIEFIKDPHRKPSEGWKIGAPRREKGFF